MTGVGVAAVQHADDRLLPGGGPGGPGPLWPTGHRLNTDQGCPFTSQEFTGLLKDHGIQISRDGTGCWRDHVFVERLWRSVTYEEVYVRAYDRIRAARQGLGRYLTCYNQTRPHRARNGHTPEQVTATT